VAKFREFLFHALGRIRRSLTPFLAIFLGGSPYLIRIDIAGEAGYDRTVRVTQDDDARVSEQIQGVAGGQPRRSIITHAISISLIATTGLDCR
jgi:hypothetical protein